MSASDRRKTILLVEDEVLIALNEASMLERQGFNVFTAASAEKALAAVDENSIDLILMDIDLGRNKMDGTEAAKIILRDHTVPIVFLSSHTEPEVVEKTENITSYGYVVKNSGETVLIASIKMAFKLFEANQKVLERERIIGREKARLQQYLDVTEILIVALDTEHRITLLNPKGCEVLGYAENEVLGKNWFDMFIVSDELDSVKAVFDEIIAGNLEPVEYHENRVRCKDGSEKVIAWHNSIFRDEKGAIIGTFSSGKDITERKYNEAAVRESEEKYRYLFENMAQGAFYQCVDGTLLDCNPAVLEQFGLTKEQFLSRTSMNPEWQVILEDGSVLPGEEHPSMVALRTGKPVNNFIAGVFNPRKNDYVWLNINAIPQFRPGEGKPFQTFVTLHDITERRNMETELSENGKLLREIARNLPAAHLSIINRDYSVDSMTEADRVFGLSVEEMFVDAASTVKKYIDKTFGGEEQTFEVFLRHRHQRYRTVPVCYRDGSVSRILAIRSDITKQKEIEENLQASILDLRRAQQIEKIGNWHFDPEIGVPVWSEELFSIFERDPALGVPLIAENKKMYEPDEYDLFYTAVSLAVSEGIPFDLKLKLKPKKNTLKWIHAVCRPVSRKSEAGYFLRGTIQDITELKRAEERIAAALADDDVF